MLLSLSIRNLVLIQKLDLDFKSGLTVLTGETGAGKSILLDALGLVLGNRADTGLIRHGAEKLGVAAVFKIEDRTHPIYNLFSEFEIEIDDTINIKRLLDLDGKGKIFVNDQIVTLKLLKEIGKYLIEIHGQFDNQGLLNPNNHLDVLDSYGSYSPLLIDVKNDYKNLLTTRKERRLAEESLAKSIVDEENLRHWVDELEKMHLADGEEENLAKKRVELMNSEKIIENLNYAYSSLTKGISIQSALRSAQSGIGKANDLTNGKYSEIIEALEQTLINAEESINSIEIASRDITANSNELETIEERLFALKALARKHNVRVDELGNVLEDFINRLETIELGSDNINALRKIEEVYKLEYMKKSRELHNKRVETAKRLDEKVMEELPPLKMEKAKFATSVEEKVEEAWNEKGFDDVSFTVATNPNSPQGAINKIASGGELARFMLALKLNLATTSNIATMIFDEVDTGIGGATAQAVGERLARLSKDVQILVVTHSPQVASKGNNHFKVEKSTAQNITTTNVAVLSETERLGEIARMLSGENITDEARAAAKALIK